jgi:hypothetical protein
MTSQSARGPAAPAATDESAIADYLEKHPDFFERHPTALARLRLPHARGAAVSLVERQVEVLRERQSAAEDRLNEFVRVARANDQLAEKIHRFTRRLLKAASVAATVAEIEASLREDFDAFNSRLVLIGDAGNLAAGSALERFLRSVPADDPALKSFETLFESARPRCGQVRDSQRDWLFGADAAGIGSAALVPLARTGGPGVVLPIGLLVVGSHDPARFHPGMSTDFLARMGDLIADALQRFR